MKLMFSRKDIKYICLVFFFVVLTPFITQCHGDPNRNLESYGDLDNTPGGVGLTSPEEHVGGWGRKDCLLCHQAALNLHRSVDSSIGDIDVFLEKIRDNGESQYCLKCHGPNGVTQ